MDEWRATIQSFIGFAEAGKSQQAEPSRYPQIGTAVRADGRVGGAILSVQSLHDSRQRGGHRKTSASMRPMRRRWPCLARKPVVISSEFWKIGGRKMWASLKRSRHRSILVNLHSKICPYTSICSL